MLLLLLIGSLLIVENRCQDFVFPEDEDARIEMAPPSSPSPRPTDNRTPVFIAGRCPPNEWLWPGKQKHEWFCDCATGYVYYTATDKCFQPYNQGPCGSNEYLVMPKNEVKSQCITNPCQNDGFVQYKDDCYELNKMGPCVEGTLGVNDTTLQLECLTGLSELSIINFPRNCPQGSKRSSTVCRPEY